MLQLNAAFYVKGAFFVGLTVYAVVGCATVFIPKKDNFNFIFGFVLVNFKLTLIRICVIADNSYIFHIL